MTQIKTDKAARTIRDVRIDQIRYLNPRARNRRNFEEIVQSIAKVGLKRPITVSPRKSELDTASYDLVCGQGRVEAFIQLGQMEIPAIVIEAEESDCLIMSLVENCARRQHRGMDLLQDINTLRMRGYKDREISIKIGMSPEYIHQIGALLDNGEERLLSAVEAGLLPINMAIEIAKSDDEEVQRALTQAYAEKKLRGKKLVAVRRLIDQRRRRGKHIRENLIGRKDGQRRPLTSEAMIRVYRQETDRQRVLVKKAAITQNRLLFVVEALRSLRGDEGFAKLLNSERLNAMPTYLEQQLTSGSPS